MSEFSIISKEAQADTLYKITKEHETMLETCIQGLEAIKKDKMVSEANLRQLTNIWREMDSLRELYYLRLLNCLKRGDKIVG